MKYAFLLLSLLSFSACSMEEEKPENTIKIIEFPIDSSCDAHQWLKEMEWAITNNYLDGVKRFVNQPIAKQLISAEINDIKSQTSLINRCLVEELILCKNSEIATTIFNAADEFNIASPDGITPLYIACRNQFDISLIQFLIKKDVSINVCARTSSYFPLHMAHSSEVINLLVQSGANLESKDSNENTPLQLNALYFLEAKGEAALSSDLIGKRINSWQYPQLTGAVLSERITKFRKEKKEEQSLYYKNMITLIFHGADINAVNKYGKNLKTMVGESTFNQLLQDAQPHAKLMGNWLKFIQNKSNQTTITINGTQFPYSAAIASARCPILNLLTQ